MDSGYNRQGQNGQLSQKNSAMGTQKTTLARVGYLLYKSQQLTQNDPKEVK